jgi:ribosomal-protein-alanine N-acetyltransferase
LLETYNLRKFGLNDLQSVTQINRVCLPENYTDYFFVDLFHRFPELFIVAENAGEVVGYIMCRVETGLSNLGLGGLIKKGHVVSVAVLPQHRRHGVGEALVMRALEAVKPYNAKQCYLEVRVSNEEAIRLYKKLGFKINKVSDAYYRDGENAYVMVKDFSI